MGEFLDAVGGFPTLAFTAALVVAVVFWLLVLCGVTGHDAFDADLDTDALALGGVPVAVSVSLLIALAWFTSLCGSVALSRSGASGPVRIALAAGVLVASAGLAYGVTRRLVRTLHRLFPDEPGPSRQDFVGMTCTIRTGRVDAGFGQAEVAARDGSTAVVQVRRTGGEPLALGSTGLLYAYDDAGEFFWVAHFDAFDAFGSFGPFDELPGPRG